jgi:hypothetical protein
LARLQSEPFCAGVSKTRPQPPSHRIKRDFDKLFSRDLLAGSRLAAPSLQEVSSVTQPGAGIIAPIR